MMPACTTGGGMTFGFPDTCKVPTPAGPVPTPFPNIAQLPMALPVKCSKKVKIGNMPVFTQNSEIPISNGDEAGVAGGVISGVFIQKATPKMGKPKVKIEGAPIMTMLCNMGQNGANPNVPMGTILAPSQVTVLISG